MAGFSVNDLIHLNGLHEAYKAADVDASEPSYFGFVRADGYWYIIKQAISGSVTSYRFAKGESGYAAAWTARASQTYDYYSNTFPA